MSQIFASPGGGLKSIQVFTASGTWVKPPGISKVFVRVVGGGGGGGGSNSVNDAAGGGGGGGSSEKLIDVSAVVDQIITVGAGGPGGLGIAHGTSGGNSQFHFENSGTGGARGLAQGQSVPMGGLGGVSSGGDINLGGSDGGEPSVSTDAQRLSGFGGASPFGGSARSVKASLNGIDGHNYGGGGSGAADNTSTNKVGGDGAGGVVIVWEYA